MTNDTCTDGTERTWSSVWCLLVGHNWVGHTAYKLKNDTGRALYGDLCETCGRFQPRSDGRDRFVNPEVRESPYDRSVEAGTDRDE